jgi:5'-deoxynucleotidase YfbR-like HD superfamily hydrolase
VEYCALAYCVQECAHESVNDSHALLLATLHDNNEIHILVHPDCRTLVQGQDLDYLKELFASFIERANEDPLALFKQLSSLSVGCLVTKCTGTKVYSELLGAPQYRHFIELR